MTALGIVLRQLRWEKQELLKDMANKVGVTSAFLSAVETGKKRPSMRLIERIVDVYQLSPEQEAGVRSAAAQVTNEIKIDLTGASPSQHQVAVSFAKALGNLTDDEISRIMNVFNERHKK